MIRSTDRISRVLERDERLIDVLIDASPNFERLRDPRLRKVMSRLVTVAAAARIAGVDERDLVERLNRALSDSRPESSPATDDSVRADRSESTTTSLPPDLANVPRERIVDLDVREDLRAGREPFSRIMTAKNGLPDGHVLRLRAIFEPAPLYHVLGKQGFAHWTERLADDDWRVWFYRSGGDERPTVDAGPGAGSPEIEGTVTIDVRGLEPPEPMVRTLAALESLPPDGTLVQLNVRVPQFLLPRLDELGYGWRIVEMEDGTVQVRIRRRTES